MKKTNIVAGKIRAERIKYYIVYRYNQDKKQVVAETVAPLHGFYGYWDGENFQQVFDKVTTFYRSFARLLKENSSMVIPPTYSLKKVRSICDEEIKDRYELSEIELNLNTWEIVHDKLGEWR